MKFKTIDEAFDWIERICEDKLRELETAMLVDAPAHGADVDIDALEETLKHQREELIRWREQTRLELLDLIAKARAAKDDVGEG